MMDNSGGSSRGADGLAEARNECSRKMLKIKAERGRETENAIKKDRGDR